MIYLATLLLLPFFYYLKKYGEQTRKLEETWTKRDWDQWLVRRTFENPSREKERADSDADRQNQ